jgi:hypothetical protein
MVHFTFLLLLAEVPDICQESSVCSFLGPVLLARKIILISLTDEKPDNPANDSRWHP